jgi:Ca-activated chloride channel family protein
VTAWERLLSAAGWRIAEPALLAALLCAVLATAVAGGLSVARRRALLLRSFGALSSRVAPGARVAPRALRLALACGGLALLSIAAARPQRAVLSAARGPVRGDLVVVLDASRSMLARDVGPDRLTHARAAIAALLEALPGRRVAVVVFAGSAHLAVPLTPDRDAARLLLDAVHPDEMPLQGTDVGRALLSAERALAGGGAAAAGARAVLLVSDGEDHGPGAAGAAERLALAGVPLFTAGVGTAAGAAVPLPGGGPARDEQGRAVVSRLDEAGLAELAARGGGRYARLDAAGIAELVAALTRLERAAVRGGRVVAWDDRHGRFALAGVLLLAGGVALPESWRRRSRRPGADAPRSPRRSDAAGVERHAARVAIAALALVLAGASPFLAEHRGVADANALAARDPQGALRLLDAAERELGARGEIDVNRGIALHRAGQFDEARRSFSRAIRARGPLASRAAYGEGVAALAQGDEGGAITAWRRALVLDPQNGAARFNLEVLLRRASEPPRGEPDGDARGGAASGARAAGAPGSQDAAEERDGPPLPSAASSGAALPSPDASAQDAPARGPRTPGTSRSRASEPSSASSSAGAPASGAASGSAGASRADLAPMSPADAHRLLDDLAARERAAPMSLAPRRSAAAPARAW